MFKEIKLMYLENELIIKGAYSVLSKLIAHWSTAPLKMIAKIHYGWKAKSLGKIWLNWIL